MEFENGTKMVPYDAKSNLPILTTKPGSNQFETYLNMMHLTSFEAQLRPSSLSFKDLLLPDGTPLL